MTLLQQLEDRNIKKGIHQGMKMEKHEIAKKLLMKRLSIKMIVDATELSIAEVEKIKQELEATRH